MLLGLPELAERRPASADRITLWGSRLHPPTRLYTMASKSHAHWQVYKNHGVVHSAGCVVRSRQDLCWQGRAQQNQNTAKTNEQTQQPMAVRFVFVKMARVLVEKWRAVQWLRLKSLSGYFASLTKGRRTSTPATR